MCIFGRDVPVLGNLVNCTLLGYYAASNALYVHVEWQILSLNHGFKCSFLGILSLYRLALMLDE